MNKPINIQSFVCEVSKCPDIQHLKAENDGLKSQLDFEIQKRETVEVENEGLKIKHQRYRECSIQFNQKLKQALEKIREIASTHCSQCREIIEKINEVLKDA